MKKLLLTLALLCAGSTSHAATDAAASDPLPLVFKVYLPCKGQRVDDSKVFENRLIADVIGYAIDGYIQILRSDLPEHMSQQREGMLKVYVVGDLLVAGETPQSQPRGHKVITNNDFLKSILWHYTDIEREAINSNIVHPG